MSKHIDDLRAIDQAGIIPPLNTMRIADISASLAPRSTALAIEQAIQRHPAGSQRLLSDLITAPNPR